MILKKFNDTKILKISSTDILLSLKYSFYELFYLVEIVYCFRYCIKTNLIKT